MWLFYIVAFTFREQVFRHCFELYPRRVHNAVSAHIIHTFGGHEHYVLTICVFIIIVSGVFELMLMDLTKHVNHL